MTVSAYQKKTRKWRWREQLAGSYLLFFLLIAIIGPASGWLQNPNNTNETQGYQPPYNFMSGPSKGVIHWLGTDQLGRDVLANLVYGAQTAIWVSLPAMVLAALIGLTLGSLAGFWGNTGFRVRLVSCVIGLVVLVLSFYYGFYIQQLNWVQAFNQGTLQIVKQTGLVIIIFALLGSIGWLIVQVFVRIGFNKQINLPLDQLILKVIEIVGAIPRLLLIMCLIAFTQPAIANIVLLATLTYWTSIARLVRGELLRVKELPFIQAARVAGLSESRILLREALPNALPPVIVAVAFGLGNLMSLEATLSFLGMGVPPEVTSWGRLMKGGIQSNFDAWWLIFFPALTLCCTILSLQVLAQRSLKMLDPTRSE